MKTGTSIMVLGGVIGTVGNLTTGSNLGSPVGYAALGLVLLGGVIGVIRREYLKAPAMSGADSASTHELVPSPGRNSLSDRSTLVTASNGEPISLQFFAGLPSSADSPCIFLLDDNSVCEGSTNRNSDSRPKGALVCSDPNGSPERYEIALGRVVGWAYSGPRRL